MINAPSLSRLVPKRGGTESEQDRTLLDISFDRIWINQAFAALLDKICYVAYINNNMGLASYILVQWLYFKVISLDNLMSSAANLWRPRILLV